MSKKHKPANPSRVRKPANKDRSLNPKFKGNDSGTAQPDTAPAVVERKNVTKEFAKVADAFEFSLAKMKAVKEKQHFNLEIFSFGDEGKVQVHFSA